MIKYKRSIIVKNIERQVKMNQILVSQKLYVTPAMRKKKKLFKIEFFLSVFALIGLSTYGICSAYDRNKNEAVSKEILQAMQVQPEKIIVEEPAIVVDLNINNGSKNSVNMNEIEKIPVNREIHVTEEQKVTASDGTVYYTIGQINIPSINCQYPILSSDTENYDTLLKIAPVKFHGANPNDVGNLCIVGHNYRNSQFFSKVPDLVNGDIIEITDTFGETVQYEVYDKYIVNESDTSCTSQLTDGKREITLITCTDASDENRVIVKAREIQ